MPEEQKARQAVPPAAALGQWERLADSWRVLRFADACLRGCAQVMFQNNALTGLLFFLAIFWGAYKEGRPVVAIGAVLATAVATETAYLIHIDRTALRNGLYGYNAVLLGLALPTFLAPTPMLWACLVVGAIISTIAMLAIAAVLSTWKIAALTAPFVFITWFILLGTYSFAALHSAGLPVPVIPHELTVDSSEHMTVFGIVISILNGIAQVFLLPSPISGVLILLGLLASSRWAAIFAVLGSLLSVLGARLLGADDNAVHSGLYAFSGVLTAVALGVAFNRPSWRVLGYAVMGVLFTVMVQGALNTVLEPFGIPTLTMPFVMASWLFLVPNRELMPEYRQ